MVCPLCGTRRAKRGCPALGRQICSVCCATQRLTQIQCPAGCAYLAAAREHPSATVVRRQQRDVGFVMESIRDLNERQSQLFVLVGSYVVRDGGALHPLIDDDVAEAMRALASTYETAVRGVIYDHRPASLPAQRLVAGLKPLLAEATKSGGTAFERDAAVVLRRVEQAIEDLRREQGGGSAALAPEAARDRRAFLDLLGRVFARDAGGETPADPANEPSRLIVP